MKVKSAIDIPADYPFDIAVLAISKTLRLAPFFCAGRMVECHPKTRNLFIMATWPSLVRFEPLLLQFSIAVKQWSDHFENRVRWTTAAADAPGAERVTRLFWP